MRTFCEASARYAGKNPKKNTTIVTEKKYQLKRVNIHGRTVIKYPNAAKNTTKRTKNASLLVLKSIEVRMLTKYASIE